jgi:hypothetical protein
MLSPGMIPGASVQPGSAVPSAKATVTEPLGGVDEQFTTHVSATVTLQLIGAPVAAGWVLSPGQETEVLVGSS